MVTVEILALRMLLHFGSNCLLKVLCILLSPAIFISG